VVHGLAHRVDRIKALGNGQVPRVAATAFSLLCEK
ncbi:DNA cytosine methyltransferase, partial [Klebsiella sp. ME-303]